MNSPLLNQKVIERRTGSQKRLSNLKFGDKIQATILFDGEHQKRDIYFAGKTGDKFLSFAEEISPEAICSQGPLVGYNLTPEEITSSADGNVAFSIPDESSQYYRRSRFFTRTNLGDDRLGYEILHHAIDIGEGRRSLTV